MSDRVRLDSTSASPLRISSAGASAATAEFNTLIFDANQPPLRLWGTGWGTIIGITRDEHNIGGKNINTSVLASGFVAPGGAAAIFCCMSKGTDTIGTTRLGTAFLSFNGNNNNGGGMGLGLSGGVVNIINTNWATLPTGDGSERGQEVAVNYCIFKNY